MKSLIIFVTELLKSHVNYWVKKPRLLILNLLARHLSLAVRSLCRSVLAPPTHKDTPDVAGWNNNIILSNPLTIVVLARYVLVVVGASLYTRQDTQQPPPSYQRISHLKI